MLAVFSGFDSAWSAVKSGAICDLLLLEDGSLRLAADPDIVNWESALLRAAHRMDVDLHVWAVDQPLVSAIPRVAVRSRGTWPAR